MARERTGLEGKVTVMVGSQDDLNVDDIPLLVSCLGIERHRSTESIERSRIVSRCWGQAAKTTSIEGLDIRINHGI